jgi:hypothetical protein
MLLWFLVLFVFVFFWLPSQIFSLPKDFPWASRLVSYFARGMFMTVMGVGTFIQWHLLNWLTLVLLYAGGVALGWLSRHHWHGKTLFNNLVERLAVTFFTVLDGGLLPMLRQFISPSQAIENFISLSRLLKRAISTKILFVLALTVILTFSILLRFEYPLRELRFGNQDLYNTLLITQQLLTGDRISLENLPLVPILATVISLLGSIPAMYVINFLGAILGVLLVLGVGYNIFQMTENRTAALIGMASLGFYWFTWQFDGFPSLPPTIQQWLTAIAQSLNGSLIRQWAGGEPEIGALFLLLALPRTWDAIYSKHRWIAGLDAACCLAMVAIAAFPLWVLMLAAGIGWLGGRRLILGTVSLTWVALALLSAYPNAILAVDRVFLVTLPVGLSLLVGFFFNLLASSGRFLLRQWSDIICFGLVFALGINFCLPLPPQLNYLEYEMAARKTLALVSQFPRKSWLIVAPIEQFVESYGAAWYEDLALFVEKYRTKVEHSNFKFPFSSKHLLIFVEKRPFVTFVSESFNLPYSVLSDPTYRYYRSTAGRASLQFEALQLGEDYRRNHPDTSSIYYEDDDLRIYYFRSPGKSLVINSGSKSGRNGCSSKEPGV